MRELILAYQGEMALKGLEPGHIREHTGKLCAAG